MEEKNYIDKIYNTISVAYSVNFMVLQNLARILPAGDNNVFNGAQIFGEKSNKEKEYDMLYTEYADIRLNYYREIHRVLLEYNQIEKFKESSGLLIDVYNKVFNKKVEYSSVFSDKDIKNWDIFTKIYRDIDEITFRSTFEARRLQYIFGCFLKDYDTYKEWLSAYEIIEALESDITPHGSKSLSFEQPSNPNIFIIEQDDFDKYAEIISKFLTKKSKRSLFKKENKSEAEIVALETISNFYNRLQDRFYSANSHVMEQGNFFSKMYYKLSHMSDGDFKVTRVYTHRNEILALITALLEYSELHELANEISVKFLGKNVEISQNKKKENT